MNKAEVLLHNTLNALGDAFLFCVQGRPSPIFPGITVEGVGDVPLPVPEETARKLCHAATQAPYGLGEETVMDPSVRKAWQLEPSSLKILNPEWQSYLSGILQEVQCQLGIQQEIQASLYKMLVYESGSFFKPHRDTEKEDGMFATLVIGLPSYHEGGELRVEHDGAMENISFGGEEKRYHFHYAAFYADCRHEVRPVLEGYRVCLVYNLSLRDALFQPQAPDFYGPKQALRSSLPALMTEEGREKLIVPLKHQYTQAGVHPRSLKGADRTRLALLTLYQSGAADESTVEHGYYGRRFRYDHSDSDDEDAEFEEILEEELTLQAWWSHSGESVNIDTMHFNLSELLTEGDYEDFAREQHVLEATGNEGVTLERWYHHAVVVLWPRQSSFRLLAAEGQHVGLPALEQYIQQHTDPSRDDGCLKFAAAVIEHWDPLPPNSYRKDDSLCERMLEILWQLKSEELSSLFIKEVLPFTCIGVEGEELSQLAELHGWSPLVDALQTFASTPKRETKGASLLPVVHIASRLCFPPRKSKRKHKNVCRTMMRSLFETLQSWDENPGPTYRWNPKDNQSIFAHFFGGVWTLGDTELHEEFLYHALAYPTIYNLHDVLLPSIQLLSPLATKNHADNRIFQELLEYCIQRLEGLTRETVPEPTNWAQEVKLYCSCIDCKELQAFLEDPVKQVHHFKVAKDRRRHLKHVMDGCDVDHVTEEKGRPFTLVCTKNRRSYLKACQRWEENHISLLELLEMKS